MGYTYSKVTTHTVTDGSKYFLDSNIWLKILQPKISPTYKDKNYRLLFDRIIANTKAKIVVPSLVISEVVNRILREVYMNKYIAKLRKTNPGLVVTSDFYKNDFRPTEDFRIAYNLVCDEIKNYHSSIELINDEFGSNIKYKHVLSDPPQGLDFNDYYYYRLCRLNNFNLVTDDKDFWIEDIPVITLSETLLNKHIALLVKINTSSSVENN